MRDMFGLDITHSPNRREIQKKVLCIALNYTASSSPQFGNIQACTSLMQTLLVQGHYTQQKFLTDISAPILKKDVITGLDWLVDDVEDGDVIALIIAGRGDEGLELGDTMFNEFNESLVQYLPLGVSLFILSDVHLPLQSRFLCKDISQECKTSKQIGSKKMPILTSKPETKRFEDVTRHETYSTVVSMYSGGSTGHLCFLLDTLLSTTHAYSIPLQTFFQYAQACMVVNGLDAECSLESGQYIDLQVPLGRLLHFPV
jgi:hypothetical protein